MPRRRVDLFFIATFAGFAVTSFLFDRTAALDNISPCSSDPFARAIYWYSQQYDPLVGANPLWLRIMSSVSAFVMGPFYIYLVHGFLKQRNAIRIPSIVYAVVMLYSMLVHTAVELLGDLRPPNLIVFALVYAIYFVAPVLLVIRMRDRLPFGPPPGDPPADR